MKLETLIKRRDESKLEYAALQAELERLMQIEWPPSYQIPGAVVDTHNNLARVKRRLQIYKRLLRKRAPEKDGA